MASDPAVQAAAEAIDASGENLCWSWGEPIAGRVAEIAVAAARPVIEAEARKPVLDLVDDERWHVGGAWGDYGEPVLLARNVAEACGEDYGRTREDRTAEYAANVAEAQEAAELAERERDEARARADAAEQRERELLEAIERHRADWRVATGPGVVLRDEMNRRKRAANDALWAALADTGDTATGAPPQTIHQGGHSDCPECGRDADTEDEWADHVDATCARDVGDGYHCERVAGHVGSCAAHPRIPVADTGDGEGERCLHGPPLGQCGHPDCTWRPDGGRRDR